MNKKELSKLGESLDVAIDHYQTKLGKLELENHVLNHFVEIKLIRVVEGEEAYTLTDKGLMFRSFLNGFFKS